MLYLLNSIQPLSVRLWERLTDVLERKTIKKNAYLQKPGQIANRIYFVESGLIRRYHRIGIREITSGFYKEGDLLVSLAGFSKQTETVEYCKAVEHSILYSLTHRDLQTIYQAFPEFNFHIRELIRRYAFLSEECLHILRSQRASDRYKWLIERHPNLVERVPGKYLASYLGMAEEVLSRAKAGKG